MSTYQHFDSHHPKPGVVIMPAPMAGKHLPFTQSRNSRIVDSQISWHVLKPTMRCEAVGLGMPSTTRTVRSPEQPIPIKGCTPGTVRPGTKRRGHKKAPKNLCCGSLIPSNNAMRLRAFSGMWANLKFLHAKLIGGNYTNTGISLRNQYENLRSRILRLFRKDILNLEVQIITMEQAHRNLFGKKPQVSHAR